MKKHRFEAPDEGPAIDFEEKRKEQREKHARWEEMHRQFKQTQEESEKEEQEKREIREAQEHNDFLLKFILFGIGVVLFSWLYWYNQSDMLIVRLGLGTIGILISSFGIFALYHSRKDFIEKEKERLAEKLQKTQSTSRK